MRLGPIVLKLRAGDTRFANRIAGAGELALALQGTLQQEMAFVIQLSESATPNTGDGYINQSITERFGVVVAMDNATSQADKTGLTAFDKLFEVRSEIFSAILGWQMDDAESLVSYVGGSVISVTRAHLWYQFEFVVNTRIDDDDGVDVGTDTLDSFDSIFAQYVLAPSAKLPVGNLTISDPDMESLIDFTTNPDVDGAFAKAFASIFDKYNNS